MNCAAARRVTRWTSDSARATCRARSSSSSASRPRTASRVKRAAGKVGETRAMLSPRSRTRVREKKALRGSAMFASSSGAREDPKAHALSIDSSARRRIGPRHAPAWPEEPGVVVIGRRRTHLRAPPSPPPPTASSSTPIPIAPDPPQVRVSAAPCHVFSRSRPRRRPWHPHLLPTASTPPRQHGHPAHLRRPRPAPSSSRLPPTAHAPSPRCCSPCCSPRAGELSLEGSSSRNAHARKRQC